MDETDAEEKRDRQFVGSLERGLSILSAFGPNDRSLSNRELADRTGLPRPTVSRFTHTLCKLNYLTYQDRLGRFSLAPRVIELSQSAFSATGISDIVHPGMVAISEMGDVSVSLGVLSNLEIRYIDMARRPEAIVINLDVGALVPLPQTAIGRAYLASLTEHRRASVIARIKEANPDIWTLHEDHVSRAIQDFKTVGYTRSFGDWRPELHAIATVIQLDSESDPLLLSVAGLSSILTPKQAETYYAPALLSTARSIGNRMSRFFLE